MGKPAAISIFLVLSIFISTAGCLIFPRENAEDYNQAGETHHAMGRYEEAVAAYDKALVLDPSFGKAWRNRGLSLAMLNRTADAEESFEKALAIDPGDLEALYFQALSRSRAGDRQGALQSLDRAVAIPPENRDEAIVLFQEWKLRGDLLSEAGRLDDANVSYRMAHEVMMSTI